MSAPDFDQTLEDTAEDLEQIAQEELNSQETQDALNDETRDDAWW